MPSRRTLAPLPFDLCRVSSVLSPPPLAFESTFPSSLLIIHLATLLLSVVYLFMNFRTRGPGRLFRAGRIPFRFCLAASGEISVPRATGFSAPGTLSGVPTSGTDPVSRPRSAGIPSTADSSLTKVTGNLRLITDPLSYAAADFNAPRRGM